MKLIQNLIFFIPLLISLELYAQDMDRVIENIDYLCDKSFFGRGYVNSGEEKATDFINYQFLSNGLSRFGTDYYQLFTFPVNIFPNAPSLKIEKKLKLGKQFLPAPSSAAGSGVGKIVMMPESVLSDSSTLKEFVKRDLSEAIVTYSAKLDFKRFQWPRVLQAKLNKVKAILLTTEKLTFGVSTSQSKVPKFIILQELVKGLEGEEVKFSVDAMIIEHTSRNIIGYIPGTESPDEFIAFTAHYDHLGGIGDHVFFPGGNDNATGVAMLLELMYYYRLHPPKKSVVMMAFAAEEAGLIGSRYYVDYPLFPLNQIDFLINLDLFASGEDGMMVVNGSVFKEEYNTLVDINEDKKYLSAIKSRGKAANSDHYFFTEAGVPSFFFYLMGDSWTHYHDIDDDSAVPLTDFKDAFQLIVDFSEELMKGED